MKPTASLVYGCPSLRGVQLGTSLPRLPSFGGNGYTTPTNDILEPRTGVVGFQTDSANLFMKMSNSSRLIIPGLPHYVSQRGLAESGPVFRESTDYRVFLHLLAESCEGYDVAIWGYSLLGRGYSLILVPESAEALHAAINRLDSEYAHYHNLRHMVRGQVWDGPFQTAAMCWSHVWDALAFVERDPVRNEKLGAAWAHPWSSAAARLGRARRAQWLNLEDWHCQWESPKWQKRLQSFENEDQFSRLLTSALENGCPLGDMLTVPAPLLRRGPQKEGVRILEKVVAV